MTIEETNANQETKDLLEPSKEAEQQSEKDTEKEIAKPAEADSAAEETTDEQTDGDEAPSLDEIRANVRKHEEELKEEREDIQFYESKLEAIQKDLTKGLPDIVANGKSIYEMTPDEFEGVIDQTYQAHEKDKAAQLVSEARSARKKYLEEAKKYAPAAAKFQQDAEKFRAKEWNLAEKELKALYPGIEKYTQQIKERAMEELNADRLLVERVNQGVVAKFRYLVNLVKNEGIEAKLNKAELKTEQGNQEKASAGKGKGSSAAEARETAYTPERIRKMSLEEYRQHKDKIYAAAGAKPKKK